MAIRIIELPTHEVVARTLWAEARSHGMDGMAAVANVIRNRVDNPGWWGKDWRGVCLTVAQFSCWNPNDPQAPVIRAVDMGSASRNGGSLMTMARLITTEAMATGLWDRTNGADHYHAEYVRPAWAKGRAPTFVIGKSGSRHLFYKLGLRGDGT